VRGVRGFMQALRSGVQGNAELSVLRLAPNAHCQHAQIQ
jgi:hypothetical protein